MALCRFSVPLSRTGHVGRVEFGAGWSKTAKDTGEHKIIWSR
jgi:hypothetical protein